MRKPPRPVTECACGDHAFCSTSRFGVAIVDGSDRSFLDHNRWSLIAAGRWCLYAYNHHLGKYLHQLVLSAQRIDHQNGNGLDCRSFNLRESNRKQNARNVRRHFDSGQPFKGSYPLPSGRWHSKIYFQGRQIGLGTHDTPELAAVAYDSAARRYFGKWARCNFQIESA